MSIRTAKPSDIYMDAHGKLWRVVSRCDEPTVTVVEVETEKVNKGRMTGGVSDLMWDGFRKMVPEDDATALALARDTDLAVKLNPSDDKS